MPARQELLAVTGVRFFLALWVILFHHVDASGFLAECLPTMPAAVASIFYSGHLAVGAFFILSGFVLSYNYSLAEPWTTKRLVRFAIARFSRIYPVYFLGLLLMVPFQTFPFSHGITPAIIVRQSFVALMNFALLQSWIPRIALTWNTPGWSLSTECFFYCCFPFVGVALWRWSGWRSFAAGGVLICLAAQIAPAFAVAIPMPGIAELTASVPLDRLDLFWVNLLTYNPVLRLPDFCLGILLGRIYLVTGGQSGRWAGRGAWFTLPALTILLASSIYRKAVAPPLLNGFLLPAFALLIFGLAVGGGPLQGLLSSKPIVFLGRASYAMYLIHMPLKLWMYWAGEAWLSSHIGGVGVMALYLLLVIVLSALVFRWFEQPSHRWLRASLNTWWDRRQSMTTTLPGLVPEERAR